MDSAALNHKKMDMPDFRRDMLPYVLDARKRLPLTRVPFRWF
jgi:hypothetical protein